MLPWRALHSRINWGTATTMGGGGVVSASVHVWGGDLLHQQSGLRFLNGHFEIPRQRQWGMRRNRCWNTWLPTFGNLMCNSTYFEAPSTSGCLEVKALVGHLLYLDNLKKKEMILNKQTNQNNNSHATEMFVFPELASLLFDRGFKMFNLWQNAYSFSHEEYGNALFCII